MRLVAVLPLMLWAGAARAEPASAGSYIGTVTLRRDADSYSQSFSVEDRGGVYEAPGADQWCAAGVRCFVEAWRPIGEPAISQPVAVNQPPWPDFLVQFRHLVLPPGDQSIGATTPAPAFQAQLDRIEALLKAICRQTAIKDPTGNGNKWDGGCPK